MQDRLSAFESPLHITHLLLVNLHFTLESIVNGHCIFSAHKVPFVLIRGDVICIFKEAEFVRCNKILKKYKKIYSYEPIAWIVHLRIVVVENHFQFSSFFFTILSKVQWLINTLRILEQYLNKNFNEFIIIDLNNT